MRYLRHTILTLLWLGVFVYMLWAGASVRRGRSALRVRSLDIEVVDSTSQGYLVTGPQVRQWISQSGIGTIGTAVEAVDLTAIERLIARNGFVSDVASYISGRGELHVRITPREPLLRLLTDGEILPVGGTAVCETAAAEDVFAGDAALASRFLLLRQTRYGAACVTLLRRTDAAPAQG